MFYITNCICGNAPFVYACSSVSLGVVATKQFTAPVPQAGGDVAAQGVEMGGKELEAVKDWTS